MIKYTLLFSIYFLFQVNLLLAQNGQNANRRQERATMDNIGLHIEHPFADQDNSILWKSSVLAKLDYRFLIPYKKKIEFGFYVNAGMGLVREKDFAKHFGEVKDQIISPKFTEIVTDIGLGVLLKYFVQNNAKSKMYVGLSFGVRSRRMLGDVLLHYSNPENDLVYPILSYKESSSMMLAGLMPGYLHKIGKDEYIGVELPFHFPFGRGSGGEYKFYDNYFILKDIKGVDLPPKDYFDFDVPKFFMGILVYYQFK
jgi:hypothetical protein